jgi:hypothetical protein
LYYNSRALNLTGIKGMKGIKPERHESKPRADSQNEGLE